ncbi:MAG: hypothetical protein VKK32_06565 [Candidatus Melainabacteria bacterium]|nr:hypothetical protein [Candidatus Melainabacteria bacterium]
MSGEINRVAGGAGTARTSGPVIKLPDFNTDLVIRRANKLINRLLAEYKGYRRLLDGPINHDLRSAVDDFITDQKQLPQELLKISKAALTILETRNDIQGQQRKDISKALRYFQDRIKLAQRTNLHRLSSKPITLSEPEEKLIGSIYGLLHQTDNNLGELFLKNLGELEKPLSKITYYELETILNVILITADQYFRSEKRYADPCISFLRQGFFPKQAENHQYLNLPGKITAKSGSNIMDKSLGITLRRDFAEKLEKLLEAHFSNLNQAQIPPTANDTDADSPSLSSLPDISRVYKLKPFYKPSQADDKPVAKARDSGTPNPRRVSLLEAIFSNTTGEESAGSSGNTNTAPQMSRKQVSEWIQELELKTPLLPYLRTACLNAAAAKARLIWSIHKP